MVSKAERDAAKAASLKAHAARILRTYGISGEQYWKLYAFQGGKCAICRRATGATKRLAVDHDHHKGCEHPPTQGCPKCVRGLLCGRCNRLLGLIRDDATAISTYLMEPPFQQYRRT